ncbi:MAG: hypothetical protein ABFE07_16300 [Armatimonadia bacterium]
MADETVAANATADERDSAWYTALGILAVLVMWPAAIYLLGSLLQGAPELPGSGLILPFLFANTLAAVVSGLISPRLPFVAGLPALVLINGGAFILLQGIDTTSERTWLILRLALVFLGGLAPAAVVLGLIGKSARTAGPRTVAMMRYAGVAALLLACAGWSWSVSQTTLVVARERVAFQQQVERLLREDLFAAPVQVTWPPVGAAGLAMERRAIRLIGEGHMAGGGTDTRVEMSIEARRALPVKAGAAREMDVGDVNVIMRYPAEQGNGAPSTAARLIEQAHLRPEWAGRLKPDPDPMFPDLGKYTATYRGFTFDFIHAGSEVRLHIYGKGRW